MYIPHCFGRIEELVPRACVRSIYVFASRVGRKLVIMVYLGFLTFRPSNLISVVVPSRAASCLVIEARIWLLRNSKQQGNWRQGD